MIVAFMCLLVMAHQLVFMGRVEQTKEFSNERGKQLVRVAGVGRVEF